MRSFAAHKMLLSYRGFTLLETILVMTILALMAFVAMPDFRSLGRSTSLEGTARQLVGVLRQARSMAISRNETVIVEFRFTPEDRSVVLMTQSQEAELSRRGRLAARDSGVAPEYVLNLPEDVYFASWETPREFAHVISNDGRRARMLFYPEGNAIPAVMVLGQDREAKQGEGVRTRYYTIEVLRTTGLTSSTRGWRQRDDETGRGTMSQQPPPLAGRRDKNFQRYVRMIRDGLQ